MARDKCRRTGNATGSVVASSAIRKLRIPRNRFDIKKESCFFGHTLPTSPERGGVDGVGSSSKLMIGSTVFFSEALDDLDASTSASIVQNESFQFANKKCVERFPRRRRAVPATRSSLVLTNSTADRANNIYICGWPSTYTHVGSLLY